MTLSRYAFGGMLKLKMRWYNRPQRGKINLNHLVLHLKSCDLSSQFHDSYLGYLW